MKQQDESMSALNHKQTVPILRIDWLRKALHKGRVDRPVFYGLLTRLWSVASGPVSALLIVQYFSPAIQGYYYTFSTLIALQVFVELGLGTVVAQFASHEWSRLSLDSIGQICGDETALSRLASLAKLAMKWYFVGAIIIAVGLSIGGYVFFVLSPDLNIMWEAPWFMLCLLTGVTVFLVPAWSLLEGCNQVTRLYTFRFYQGLCCSISAWISLYAGFNLWVPVISSATWIITSLLFIFYSYPHFFKSLLFHIPTGNIIDWRRDILPMQWRIAVSWISGYFVFSLFTPVLFHYHGSVIAGQFGMTWSIVGAVGGVASAWLAPKVPQFGMLIAKRDFVELDKLFWKVSKTVSAVIIVLSLCCWISVYALNILIPTLAIRLLPPLPFGIFLLAQAIVIFSLPFSAYLRAHKQEPLLALSLIAGIVIAISTVVLGKNFSAIGMAIGYLIVNAILIPFVVIIWLRCKKIWHSAPLLHRADLSSGAGS